MTCLRTVLILACCSLAAAAPAVAASGLQESTPQHSRTSDPVLVHLDGARRAAEGGDVERALDHVRQGLVGGGHARRSYTRAQLELWAIRWRERTVLDRVAAGDLDGASEMLVRMSEPLRSSFARQRLELLEQQLDDAFERAGSRASGDVHDARLARRVAAYVRLLDRADAELQRAGANGRRTVESARRAESALRRYRSVERDVDRRLSGLRPEDPGVAQLVAVQLRSADGVVRSMLRIADARTTQGDFRGALEWVDLVQQRDPVNQVAMELRRTIQIAAAASSAWLGFGGAAGAMQ